MLLLTSTADLVRVITGAAADIEVHASWMDNAAGTITPGRTNTASITTATTTTVVGSPAASTQRNLKHLNIRNNHASTSCNVDVDHTDGTTAEELIRATLLAGETLVLDQEGRWTHYDVNGAPYGAIVAATQADMEAGTSLVTTVTPGRQHQHPSAGKFWVKAGLTGNILASYNVTSLTDTGVGALTITIATDFSSADWCCVATIGLASTTVAQSCTYDSMAAGTVILRSVVEAGSAADPVTWSCAGFGDQ